MNINSKNSINVNGINIISDEDGVHIKFNGKGSNGNIIMKDTLFKEDFNGNIEVKGENVKIIIEGDVNGNIVGAGEVQIMGDIVGNIVGGNVRR